jgi:hypothetical protein
MIHLAETVTVGSVEDFLDASQRTSLAAAMAEFMDETARYRFGVGRAASIHDVPGRTSAQIMASYEPAGRVEVTQLPADVEEVLQGAFDRARPAVSRLMPSVTGCRPWAYVEYGPGQFITGHIDGIAPDPLTWPRQIAGISVILTPAPSGGDFYVETTSSGQPWGSGPSDVPGNGYAEGIWLAREGADHTADRFVRMPRTRWTARPVAGTALLYGSQLAHGTEPVDRGRVAKFISWLIAEPGRAPVPGDTPQC